MRERETLNDREGNFSSRSESKKCNWCPLIKSDNNHVQSQINRLPSLLRFNMVRDGTRVILFCIILSFFFVCMYLNTYTIYYSNAFFSYANNASENTISATVINHNKVDRLLTSSFYHETRKQQRGKTQ